MTTATEDVTEPTTVGDVISHLQGEDGISPSLIWVECDHAYYLDEDEEMLELASNRTLALIDAVLTLAVQKVWVEKRRRKLTTDTRSTVTYVHPGLELRHPDALQANGV